MKIRTKMMIVLLIAAVLPALIIMLAYQSRLYGVLEQNHQKYLESLSGEAASHAREHYSSIEMLMFNVRTQVVVVDYLKQVNSTNYTDVQNQLQTSQIGEKLEFILDIYPDIQYIGIVPVGDGIKLFRGYFSPINRRCTDLPFVQNVVSATDGVYTQLIHDDSRHKNIALFATSIMDGYRDEVLGYLCAVVDPTSYFKTMIGSYDDTAFYVQDAAGQLVFQGRDEEGQPVAPSDSSVVIQYDLLPMRWKMVFLANANEIRSDLLETTTFMIRLVLVFVFFAICSILYFHAKIYVPVQRLTDQLNGLERYVPEIQVSRVGEDEIGQLGNAFNHLICRVNEQISEIEDAERAKAELEIRALQAQITPHFLYNTLNVIKCMARLGQNENITRITVALIDLLRISASKERKIPLSREIDYVQAYTSLMAIRSGQTIEVRKDVADGLETFELPKLTLQPIVENSILHGNADQHGNRMLIQITAFRREDGIHIEIADDGCGMTSEKLRELNDPTLAPANEKNHFSGIGINNIRQRLCLEFGPQARVQARINRNGGATLGIIIPGL